MAMKKKSILTLLALGAFSGLVSSFLTGCSGDYYGTSGYISTGYGYGMHDPYFYDSWYGGGTVIVTPPPSRPVRPVHPIAPARPTPRPLPAPIPRGR